MTVQEMVLQVYELLGEPSDLDPYDSSGSFDVSSDGASKILGWLNRGYRRILFWKFPSGRLIRFRSLKAIKYFKSATVSGTAANGGNSSITLASTEDNTADQYVGWVVEITDGTGSGQKRLIVEYSTSRVATVDVDWDTNPDSSSEYKLYKRFWKYLDPGTSFSDEHIDLNPVSDIVAAQRVVDLKYNTELVPAGRTDHYETYSTVSGDPSVWFEEGDRLWFDTNVDEERWFQLDYTRMPSNLTGASDTPEIPEIFHEGIVLWTVWWGNHRLQDPSRAYAFKKDLESFMSTTKEQLELSYEESDGYVEVL